MKRKISLILICCILLLQLPVQLIAYAEGYENNLTNIKVLQTKISTTTPSGIVSFSVPVMDYAGLVAEIAAANSGDTIILGADIVAVAHTAITIAIDITLTSEIGQNFTFIVPENRHFTINNGGILRLENVTLSGDSLSVADISGGVQVNNGGHLYLNAEGVIEGNRALDGGGVLVNSGGTFTMNDGTSWQLYNEA